MEILGFGTAVIMGTVLGLMGGGGSILSVPIFVYIFKIPPYQATAYSLFVVGLSALIGSLQYFRLNLVRVHTAINFAVPSFAGIFLMRKIVLPAIPNQLGPYPLIGEITKDLVIMFAFSIVMILAAVSMIRKNSGRTNQVTGNLKKRLLVGIQGFFVGCLAGFVGAGGGFLIIPALVMLVGLPMKEAVGTSLLIIATQSMVGVLGSLESQEFDWLFLLKFAIFAILGIIIGSKLSQRVSNEKLKVGFGYFVLIMGIFIMLQESLK